MLERPAPDPEGSSEFPFVDYATWRSRVEQELKGIPFEKALVSPTPEGIPLQPLYIPLDWPSASDPSGFPGYLPFTRGGRPLGAARDGWQLCPHYLEPGLEALNAGLLADLRGGMNAAWLTLDRAGRLGLDPSAVDAAAAVGLNGVALYRLEDLDRALEGVELELIATHLDGGGNALPVAALAIGLLEARGIDPRALALHLHVDPLGALARDGALPGSLETAERDMARLTGYCLEALPRGRAVAVSTLPYHDAGTHAVQELAFAIATGVHYLRVLERDGIGPADAARQLEFTVAIGRDLFTELSKLRALRRLWGMALRGCGETDPPPAWIHAVSSSRTLTVRDPWVNLLRVTTQTFAAMVGGADVLTPATYDQAAGLPDALGRRIARNTPLILAEESHLGRVVDPAGGAWYLERRTDELARAAWSLFQEIEREGGMAESLLSGRIRARIDQTWEAHWKELTRRREPILGVSEFPNPGEVKPLRRDLLEAVRAEALERFRAPSRLADSAERNRRDEKRGINGGTRATAGGTSNSARPALRDVIVAARAGAALHELTEMCASGGAPARLDPFPLRRESAPFEALRDATDLHAAAGNRPRVYLANLGPVAEHTPRATFARGLFQVGGLEVIDDPGTATDDPEAVDALAARFLASGAAVACLCGTDVRYDGVGVAVARALLQQGAKRVLLAGRPGEIEASLREAGIEGFIFIGCDVYQVIAGLLIDLEVLS